MIKSLLRYSRNFSTSLLLTRQRNIVANDFYRSLLGPRRKGNAVINPWSDKTYNEAERAAGLAKAVDWLLEAQKAMKDDGFGSYRIIGGWTSSYVETSGYIIPSLIRYGTEEKRQDITDRAILASEWLLTVQKPSGGFQGECIDDNRAEVVFNTGQVIRGLISAYQQTNEKRFLDGACKAADWLCSIQESDGCWKKNAFMNVPRVYDSYVDAPLLLLHRITGNPLYKETALRNLLWIIEKKQNPNGWFEDCDNTIRRNSKPILHTLSYTIDGLLECGQLLNDQRFIASAVKAADVLFERFNKNKFLNGRYDRNWKGSEYPIVTGCAQIAIIWFQLFKHTGNIQYFNAGLKMNDFLLYVQDRGLNEQPETRGAMPGSFPIWGKYEPFNFPNWATKYFVDSLLLEKECFQLTDRKA
ncbi:MAG TPA: beta-L-arabinofuranosidase domain-containing protein [Bacteroidia bacterium]|jgi:hypothetical protein|nr:beta-L-arabinofuranosidase domain-containing protein [Bacteroidia bacterium]